MRPNAALYAFAPMMALLSWLATAQQTDEAELAKQTLNPVAALISVPIKYDYNTNIGPSEQGNQSVLTIQPVIPISISADWNLISRTIIPGVNQHNVRPGAGTADGLGDVESGSGTEEGIGDITQQFYFSPKKLRPFFSKRCAKQSPVADAQFV